MITFEVLGNPVTQGSGKAIKDRATVPELPISPKQGRLETPSDVAYATTVLRRLIGDDVDPTHMFSFVVEGAPASKSRARWAPNQRRTYTPTKTVVAQKVVEHYFRETLDGLTLAGSVAIVAIFYRPNFQRIDADNLMKLVMDAGTRAAAWEDDCYVTAQAAFMELDRERPRTVVALCQTESSLDRMRMFSCAICGKDFRRPKCDQEFDRGRSAQRYCSDDCKTAVRLVRQKEGSQRPKATCQSCGGPVSRREYLQCANCRPKGRKLGSKNKGPLKRAGEAQAPGGKHHD